MTHLLTGTADPEKVRKLRKIGLDVSCYHCGARPETLWANRALDGRVLFACADCREKVG